MSEPESIDITIPTITPPDNGISTEFGQRTAVIYLEDENETSLDRRRAYLLHRVGEIENLRAVVAGDSHKVMHDMLVKLHSTPHKETIQAAIDFRILQLIVNEQEASVMRDAIILWLSLTIDM